VITKYLGKKTAVIYITTLVASSLAFGLLLDVLWNSWNLSFTMQHHGHSMLPKWLELVSAILMIGLFGYVFIKNLSWFNKSELIQVDESNMISNFTVSSMTCNNCVMHVENALKKVDGVENVVIDLGSKKVNVEHADQATMEQLKTAVSDAGYSVD
jgi:copper chaperone CopZ